MYLRLRRFLCHRSEPDWHFPEKPITWAYRWNALSSTRWEMTAGLPPYICAFGDSSAIGPSRTGIFRRSRSTLRQARKSATSWQSYRCARRGNSRVCFASSRIMNFSLASGTRMRCWAWTRCRSLPGRRTRWGRWRHTRCWRHRRRGSGTRLRAEENLHVGRRRAGLVTAC